MSAEIDERDKQHRAKRYEAIHNGIFIVETVYTILLLLAFLFSRGSNSLADFARSKSSNPWIYVAIYGAAVVVATKILFLPLSFFGDYYLEHRFGLSNEKFGAWVVDELKTLGLNLALTVVILDVMYFLLRQFGNWWWIGAGVFFLIFGVVLATLVPVVLLPMFYKVNPLDNESLRQRLTVLGQRVGAKVLGVYRMGMSEKTKKANAMFAGLGSTKRIILGDTLLDNFSENEIEVVMAHEMAHYKHGDITKLIFWRAMTTFVGLKVADIGLHWGMTRLGYEHVWAIEAFPLLALCLFVFGLVVMPLNNAFSRSLEWKADTAALQLTGNRDAFISAMRKLGEQNLADLSPHPAVEFLLHDHPSLARRIAWAEQWQGN